MDKQIKRTTTRVLRAIRDSRKFAGAQRLLMDAIALRESEKHKYWAWPSYACLAADTGMDRATLSRAASKLKKDRFLEIEVRRNRSNRFRIILEALLDAVREREESEAKGADEADEADDDNDNSLQTWGKQQEAR